MSAPKPSNSAFPFPKRWLVFIALKFVILGLVIYTALHLKGLV